MALEPQAPLTKALWLQLVLAWLQEGALERKALPTRRMPPGPTGFSLEMLSGPRKVL